MVFSYYFPFGKIKLIFVIQGFAEVLLLCVVLQKSLTILNLSSADTGGASFRKSNWLWIWSECVLKKIGSLYIPVKVLGLGISFPVLSN